MAVPSPVGDVEIVWRARMVQCLEDYRLEHAPPTSVAEFESRGQRHMRDDLLLVFVCTQVTICIFCNIFLQFTLS